MLIDPKDPSRILVVSASANGKNSIYRIPRESIQNAIEQKRTIDFKTLVGPAPVFSGMSLWISGSISALLFGEMDSKMVSSAFTVSIGPGAGIESLKKTPLRKPQDADKNECLAVGFGSIPSRVNPWPLIYRCRKSVLIDVDTKK